MEGVPRSAQLVGFGACRFTIFEVALCQTMYEIKGMYGRSCEERVVRGRTCISRDDNSVLYMFDLRQNLMTRLSFDPLLAMNFP